MIGKLYLPALFLSICLIWPVVKAEVEIKPDQAAALYLEAFESLKLDLSKQEKEILNGKRNGKMSEETRTHIQEGLKALSRAASAKTVDWPLNYPDDEIFPFYEYLGPARNAVQMSIWYAKEFGSQNPDEALDIFRDTLSVSRHLSQEGMLIHSLVSIAIDDITLTAVQDLAGQWNRQDRERLIEIIRSHAPDRSVRKTVVREAKHLSSQMRKALFSVPERASLSEVLRISSIVILPEKTWIGLEHLRLGLTFTLEPGQTRHGIELVAFNPQEDFAIIRSKEENEEAIIHLQARKIAPMYPENLFRLLGIETNGNVAEQLMNDAIDNPMAFTFQKFLTGKESDAEIALMLLNEMEAPYKFIDDLLAQPFGNLPTDRNPKAELTLPENAPTLTQVLAPTFLRVRRAEQASQTNREMAIAALHLLDNPQATIPKDPFSSDGEPLQVTMENDVIEVRSQLQAPGDQPHSFRLKRN